MPHHPLMHIDELHCKPITDMLTDVPPEKIVCWNKEAYKNCDLDYGSICPERHCHYAVINIKNGEKIWITCGRPIWPLQKGEENANS